MGDDLNLALGRLAGTQDAIIKRQDEHYGETKERLARIESEISKVRHGQANLHMSVTELQRRWAEQDGWIKAIRHTLDAPDGRLSQAERKLEALGRLARTFLRALSLAGLALTAVLAAFSKGVGAWLSLKMGFGP